MKVLLKKISEVFWIYLYDKIYIRKYFVILKLNLHTLNFQLSENIIVLIINNLPLLSLSQTNFSNVILSKYNIDLTFRCKVYQANTSTLCIVRV